MNIKKQLFAFTAASIMTVQGFLPAAAQERARVVDAQVTEGNSAMAISYPEGPTLGVKFNGTHRLPRATGEAKIERKRGRTDIEIRLDEMKPASFFGGDYATYVLWIVSPEGQVDNVGEFVLRGNNGKLNVTTPLQTFAMFVTAEPHYLVSAPSRFVVVENTRPKHNITGQMLSVSTIKYRGYEGLYSHSQETPLTSGENI